MLFSYQKLSNSQLHECRGPHVSCVENLSCLVVHGVLNIPPVPGT